MSDSLFPVARPTIAAYDWRRLTVGCRDKDEVRRVLAAYQDGYGAGQVSISEAIHPAMMAAIATPQPPIVPDEERGA